MADTNKEAAKTKLKKASRKKTKNEATNRIKKEKLCNVFIVVCFVTTKIVKFFEFPNGYLLKISLLKQLQLNLYE